MTASLAAPDLMDRIYRHQRHVYDLSRRYYLLGRDRLIERLAPAPGDVVLEIGCGTARNLVLAAQRYPVTRFCGIDVSTEMLRTAENAIARAGLSARIRVAQADATGFDARGLFGQLQFERVFFSYSLSMIPAWRAALDSALLLLAPGGELHVVDFGGQERLPGWFRIGLRRWLALFHVTPRDKLEANLAVLADCANATVQIERPYRGYAQYAVVRRCPPATARS